MSKDEVGLDPIVIGEVSAPPFVRLPNPTQLFIDRALRLRALAARSQIAPYLRFLSDLVELQYRIQDGLPEPSIPNEDALRRSEQHGMPALDPGVVVSDSAFDATCAVLFGAAADLTMPAAAVAALARVQNATPALQGAMQRAVLDQDVPEDALAEHAYVAAALQVHFARRAARLDPGLLGPIDEGRLCPSCGCPPVATMVVDWKGAHSSRFCSCPLCGTLWHYVRIKCALCGSTKGIGYQELEGGDGSVKAETCDGCHRYVKVLYQTKVVDLDPVADDVASLGLDLLMRSGPYRRGSFNPFLLGY